MICLVKAFIFSSYVSLPEGKSLDSTHWALIILTSLRSQVNTKSQARFDHKLNFKLGRRKKKRKQHRGRFLRAEKWVGKLRDSVSGELRELHLPLGFYGSYRTWLCVEIGCTGKPSILWPGSSCQWRPHFIAFLIWMMMFYSGWNWVFFLGEPQFGDSSK